MNQIRSFYEALWLQHKRLVQVGWLNLLLGFSCLFLMEIDDRILTGVNVWLKPMKFAFSLAIFSWTIVWWLTIYPYSAVWKRRIGNGFAFFTLLEIAIIILQAARGELSHYNTTSPINSILFMLMGIGIYSMTTMMLIFAIHSFSKKLKTNKAVIWSIRLSWIAMIMAFIGGQMMIIAKQHTVGMPDGGAGLPVTNWSNQAGDLRVMHFLGLHAMQILPIITGWFVDNKYVDTLQKSTNLAIALGIIYLALVLFTFGQALSKVPFIA